MHDRRSAHSMRKSIGDAIRLSAAALSWDTAPVDRRNQRKSGAGDVVAESGFDWDRYCKPSWGLMLPCPACEASAEEWCTSPRIHTARLIAVINAAKAAADREDQG